MNEQKIKTNNDISKEKIIIKGGLGPLQVSKELELDILPLTVFIGPGAQENPWQASFCISSERMLSESYLRSHDISY